MQGVTGLGKYVHCPKIPSIVKGVKKLGECKRCGDFYKNVEYCWEYSPIPEEFVHCSHGFIIIHSV